MAKCNKLSVRSLQSINMADVNYMTLHKRMYIIYGTDGSARIHLRCDDSVSVSIDVVDSAAKDFLSYEISFVCMLNLFAALCVKFGEVPF